jgi:diadenosine tetraphosphate (Ap4A) HIT family hydrolase
MFEGNYWYVEHAYPCGLKGWLVLVLKRHVEALHELSMAEFLELAELQAMSARLLREVLGCEKEYMMCFAEAEGFAHIHFHVVAKAPGLPEELRGPRIFAMLKVGEEGAVPREEIRHFCDVMRGQFASKYLEI